MAWSSLMTKIPNQPTAQQEQTVEDVLLGLWHWGYNQCNEEKNHSDGYDSYQFEITPKEAIASIRAIVNKAIGDDLTLKEYAPNHIAAPDTETAIKIEGKNRHNELLAEIRQRFNQLLRKGDE